jgi:hypothetical protein
MKAPLASILAATLLWGCGGGGGNAGICSGSPEYCAEFAADSPQGELAPTDAGVAELFTANGTGDTVFNLPATVTRLRIQATHGGSAHNFVVKVGAVTVVDTQVGTSVSPPSFDSTLSVPAGAKVEVLDSSGVNWSFTQATN